MTFNASSSHLTGIIEALILLIIVLLLWGGHFFPWHIIPALVESTGKRELKRLWAYVYGVGCIWLGAVAYAEMHRAIGLEPVLTVGNLTCIIIAAAVGTILPRLVKRIRDWQVKLSETNHE
ncbi:hypothetical protein ANRL4_00874 [Anaerolineae bacterium]|nr:hypothetical protein ANRL4_00874 [Anaerolineae bacterium]